MPLALSKRQSQVLVHILLAKPTKEIARDMKLSPATIKTHLTAIYLKSGVTNRFELWAKLKTDQPQPSEESGSNVPASSSYRMSVSIDLDGSGDGRPVLSV